VLLPGGNPVDLDEVVRMLPVPIGGQRPHSPPAQRGWSPPRGPSSRPGLLRLTASRNCSASSFLSSRSARRPRGLPADRDRPGRRRRPGRSAVTSPAIEAWAPSGDPMGQGTDQAPLTWLFSNTHDLTLLTLRSPPTRVVCIALQ
jgi:hypothetical protein